MERVLKVLVTGAAGQIAYSLIAMIGNGDAFGSKQKIHLVLLDLPFSNQVLKGVSMEIEDCNFDCLSDHTVTTDPEEAFKDIDVAILVGAAPRKQGMERSDLLKINGSIFKEQGKLLDRLAKKTVKVLVVGNPANTNCLVAMKNAPTIPAQNFSALTRLDHHRLKNEIAKKMNCHASQVKHVAIWGNHSSTQYPDISYAYVEHSDGRKVEVASAVGDDDWLKKTLVCSVQQRGAAVIAARQLSSAMSAARAIVKHLSSWFNGTDGDWVSMSVVSDGSYGVEEGLIFSFPVTCSNGQYEIVKGLCIGDFSKEMINSTQKELIYEREVSSSLF